MPYSSDVYKSEVFQHIKDTLLLTDKILDVGPGEGKYGRALINYNIDAIEIYQPYIEQFNLKSIYKNVYLGNILHFDWKVYDYIILGDVLEHISIDEAKKLIKDITNNKIKCLVAVPYMYPQGECYGNVYETHLQPDLTLNTMKERYSELNILFGADDYGYYINYI